MCMVSMSAIDISPSPFSAPVATSPQRAGQLHKPSVYRSFGHAVQALIASRLMATDFKGGGDQVRRMDTWGDEVLYERRMDIEIRRHVFVSLGLKEGETVDLKMMAEAFEVARPWAAQRPPVPLADVEVRAFDIVCHYLWQVAADQGAEEGESLIVLPAETDLEKDNKAWPVVGSGAGWPTLPALWPSAKDLSKVKIVVPNLSFEFKPGDKLVVLPLPSGHGGSPLLSHDPI